MQRRPSGPSRTRPNQVQARRPASPLHPQRPARLRRPRPPTRLDMTRRPGPIPRNALSRRRDRNQVPLRAQLPGLTNTSASLPTFPEPGVTRHSPRSSRRTNVPRKTMFKIGLATAAAAVAAIMAITSAFAHGTPTTTGRSIVATIVNTASGAGMVSNDSIASTTISDEQDQDAIEAAELAAKIAAPPALPYKLARAQDA